MKEQRCPWRWAHFLSRKGVNMQQTCSGSVRFLEHGGKGHCQSVTGRSDCTIRTLRDREEPGNGRRGRR